MHCFNHSDVPLFTRAETGNNTYLLGFDDLVVNCPILNFHQKLCHSSYGITYLGTVRYVRDGEEDEYEVRQYRIRDVWGYGSAYLYVGEEVEHVKFIDVDFYGMRYQTIRDNSDWKEASALFTWALIVFREKMGWGKEDDFQGEKTEEYDDLQAVWMRPENIKVTATMRILISNGKWDTSRWPIVTIKYDVM